MWVMKLGGSLYGSPELDHWLEAIAAHGAGKVVVVPGGGRFADAVRDSQHALGFDDLAAHNMAVLAMAQAAHWLHACCNALRPVDSADALADALGAGHVAVWQPLDLRRDAPDELTSWDVTSDSLAAWLAERLHAQRLLLVKWDAPPPHADHAALAATGYVDAEFARFARRFGGPVTFLPRDAFTRLPEALRPR
jgi:aspartokinase-like uncharacterized kinase